MISSLAPGPEINSTYPYLFINSSALPVTSSPNATNGSDFDPPVFPAYIRTTSIIFCVIILGIGVIGNVMVPLVILKSKDMRNSTNIFLMNLSIADLMVLLVCTPTVLVEVNSKPETWVLGEEMYVRKATYMTRGHKMLMAIKCPEERGQAVVMLKRSFEMADSGVPATKKRKPLPKGGKEGTSVYQLQPQCTLSTTTGFPKNEHPTLTSDYSAKEEASVYPASSKSPSIHSSQQKSNDKEHTTSSSESSAIVKPSILNLASPSEYSPKEEAFVYPAKSKSPSIHGSQQISIEDEHSASLSEYFAKGENFVNVLLKEPPSILNKPIILTEQEHFASPSESSAKEEASVYTVSTKSPSIRSPQQKSIEKEHSPSSLESSGIEEDFLTVIQKEPPSILNQPEMLTEEEHPALPSKSLTDIDVYVNLLLEEESSILSQSKISTEGENLTLTSTLLAKEEASVYKPSSKSPSIHSPQQTLIDEEPFTFSSECSAKGDDIVNLVIKEPPSILNQPQILIEGDHLALPSESSAKEEDHLYSISSKSPSICNPQRKSIEKEHAASSADSSAKGEDLVHLFEPPSVLNQPDILPEEKHLDLPLESSPDGKAYVHLTLLEPTTILSLPKKCTSKKYHSSLLKSLSKGEADNQHKPLTIQSLQTKIIRSQPHSSSVGSSEKEESNSSAKGETNVHVLPSETTCIEIPQITINDKERHNSSLDTSDKVTSILSSRETTNRRRRNDRKNFCIFCFTLCSNFRRHLLRKHKNEMEVAEYMALLQTGGNEETEESKAKRNNIFEKLRNKGNYEYNKLLLKDVELCHSEEIEFLPSRRPKGRQAITVEKYVTCSLCNSAFSKSSFRKHVPKCSEKYSVDDPDSDIEDDIVDPNSDMRARKCPNFIKKFGLVNAFMADTVSENLKKNIIPLLKLNDAVKAALKDPLIMSIASDFHSNHLQIKDKYVVTKKIHDAGKFLISVKDKDSSIKTLQDCFNPLRANAVLDTVREMCGTDSETGNVRIVGMPSRLSWLLNEGASRALVDSICNEKLTTEQKDSIKKNISEFNKVKKLRWRFVASSNAELTRKRRKIEAPKIMPYDEDIKKFSTYLYEQETKLFEQLKKDQTCDNYERLCEVTIAHIITLSRRRPAEAANAELNNYKNRNKKEIFSPTILDTLDNDQRQAMEKLRMFVVPGNNEHEVPVLLTDQMTKNIDLFVSLRASFSIPLTNKLLFARPGLETPFSGTKVMSKLVSKCPGLKRPAHLTPTGLRHHVASVSQVHGDTFVNHLAKFMGHTAHIHKKNYQLPSEVLQRAVVGKELLAMEGTVGQTSIKGSPIGQDADASNVNLGQNVVLHEDNDVWESDRLSASTSRCKKRWTEEEKKIVLEEFRGFIELKKNPGLPKCREVIEKYNQLKGRTEKQLNAMIDNINKGKLKLNSSKQI